MNSLFKRYADVSGDVAVRRIMQTFVFSYALGWTVLAFSSSAAPILSSPIWKVCAVALGALTFLLSLTLSLKVLAWWSTLAGLFATVRSLVYLDAGALSPLGVWLLVMSGVSITVLAVISVNALSGGLDTR